MERTSAVTSVTTVSASGGPRATERAEGDGGGGGGTGGVCTRRLACRVFCTILFNGLVLVCAVQVVVWGPTGLTGAQRGGVFTEGSSVRAWARSINSARGTTVPRPWNWLPFCWPKTNADGEPLTSRQNSLYDYMTGTTVGASVYTFPVADVTALRAYDPDKVHRPPREDTLAWRSWEKTVVCVQTLANDAADQRKARREDEEPVDTPMQRWRDVSARIHTIDLTVDGDLPIAWEDDGGSLHRGVPLSPGDGTVYTHYDFMVWYEPIAREAYTDAEEGDGVVSLSFVRVTVRPGGVVHIPPLVNETAGSGSAPGLLEWTSTVRLAHSSLAAVRRLDVFYLIDGSSMQAPILVVTIVTAAAASLLVLALLIALLGRNVRREFMPDALQKFPVFQLSVSRGEAVRKSWAQCATHGEVFRMPRRLPRLLAALVGTGWHLIVFVLLVPIFGGAGLLLMRWWPVGTDPSNEGTISPVDRLVSVALAVFIACQCISGYVSNATYFAWVLHERHIRTTTRSGSGAPRDAEEGTGGGVERPLLEVGDDGAGTEPTVAAAAAAAAAVDTDNSPLWKRARHPAARGPERILQDWLSVYVDLRQTTLTALLLPVIIVPLVAPLAFIQGALVKPVVVTVLMWVVSAWVSAAIFGHVAVAWVGVRADPPTRVTDNLMHPGLPSLPLRLLAAPVAGSFSTVTGGIMLFLAVIMSVKAGGYIYVFPMLIVAALLWFATTGGSAMVIVWRRLLQYNWEWQWPAWAAGAFVFPVLFFSASMTVHWLMPPATAWASARLWYACGLVCTLMAIAHGSVAYAFSDWFVWALYRRCMRGVSQA